MSNTQILWLQAKPDAGKLVIGTIALLIGSTTNLLVVCFDLQLRIYFICSIIILRVNM